MHRDPELIATIVLFVSSGVTSIVVTILFPFADVLWGSIVNGIITGGTLTLQLLALAYYAHPNVLQTTKAKCIWIFSFLLAMLAHVIFYVNQGFMLPREVVAARWLLYDFVYTIPFFAFPPQDAEDTRLLEPLTGPHEDSYELSLPEISSRQKSGAWGFYITGVLWGHGCYMVGELVPGYYISYAGIIGALLCLGCAVLKSVGKVVQYDKALLFCHAWILNGISIVFIAIFNLSSTIGPLAANVLVLGFGLILQRVCWRQGSTLTTEQDALLFLFPVTLATDLTQLLLYTTDDLSYTTIEFWYLLALQESVSLFFNTGTKEWLYFQFQRLRGKALAKDNPLLYRKSFAIIHGKASIDMLSEHVSLLVIVVGVFGGIVAEIAGATDRNCAALCEKVEPWPVLESLGVVFAVRLLVTFTERRILAQMGRKVIDASLSDSCDAFTSRISFGPDSASRNSRRLLSPLDTLSSDSSSLLGASLNTDEEREPGEFESDYAKKHERGREALQTLALLSATVIIEILTINRHPLVI